LAFNFNPESHILLVVLDDLQDMSLTIFKQQAVSSHYEHEIGTNKF